MTEELEPKLYDESEEFYDSAVPPRPTKKWSQIMIRISLGIAAILLLMVGYGILLEVTSTSVPFTVKDRSILLDINQLSEWIVDDYPPEKDGETVTKTRYIDNSYQIIYEYDIPDDPNAPYLETVVSVETNSSDATASYWGYWNGFKLGWTYDILERDDLFSWGKQSHFAILSGPEGPMGNAFITQKGKRVFFRV